MNYEQTYYQAPQKKAADFRRIAKQSLKGFWWMAALVTLIAVVLGGVSGNSTSVDFDTSDFEINLGDTTTQTPQFTPEQIEAFETAIEELDFATMGDILSTINPILGFIISNFVITILLVVGAGLLINLLVSSPVKVGYQRFCLEVLDGNTSEVRVGTLFRFFTESYGKTIALNFVHSLIMTLTLIPMYIGLGVGVVQFMGTLPALLASETPQAIVLPFLTLIGVTYAGMIISMIINIPVSYMYSMAHMIMADYPNVGAMEALRLSRQMMKGNKFRLFCLDFSFIGWYLLGACACGLGMYFVMPYQYVARAAFYHEISNRHGHEEVEFPSVNPEDYIIE